MKTLYDLREKQDIKVYDEIQSFYKESLNIVRLEEDSINACIGCWTCWLKTPGLCVMKDEMVDYYREYVTSDTVVLLFDTAQGFINHRAKAFFDRTIPHYHPYIELVDGECHHIARYKKYPTLVFYFDSNGLTKQEDQVIEDYMYRMAYHFKSKSYRIVKDGTFSMYQLHARNPKSHVRPYASTEPIEKLVIYNGSPRRSIGNSSLILTKVLNGLGDRIEIRDLKQKNKWDEWAEAFKNDKHVMFLMPLYVHAMPSHVMAFIEKLEASQGSISFFVQSGFPESSQSHYLEAYLNLLALRLNRTYLGTAIKGGMEGLKMSSTSVQDKMIEPIVNTINHLVEHGKFDSTDLSRLAIPIRFNQTMKVIFGLLSKIGFVNSILWDKQIKANNAYKNRFDQPYNATNQQKAKI